MDTGVKIPSLNVLCSNCRCHGHRCFVVIGGSLDFSKYYHACSPFRSVVKSPLWRSYETASILSTVPIPSAYPKRQVRNSRHPRWKQVVFWSGKSRPVGRVTDVPRSLHGFRSPMSTDHVDWLQSVDTKLDEVFENLG